MNQPIGENPFSTKYTRPGAVPYLFPRGESASFLVDHSIAQQSRGAIIGPHGSGKSTLLVALAAELRDRQIEVCQFTLRDGQRQLPANWRETVATKQRTPSGNIVLFVDGYEQLSRFAAWRLRKSTLREGWGLLVTAHQPTSLPTIFTTSTSASTLKSLASALLDGPLPEEFSTEQLTAIWQQHDGNLREALFALYDVYERQRRC